MTQITPVQFASIRRVGVDLAKTVIQVHAVDGGGRRVLSKAIKREQFIAWCAQLPKGCLVAMEACSGAHAWGRRLVASGMDARLIAASFVSPYRMEGKSGKNDMTDAEPGHEQSSGLFVPGEEPGHWPGAPCKGRRCAKPPQGRRCALCRSRRRTNKA
jgi:hypothetical protein